MTSDAASMEMQSGLPEVAKGTADSLSPPVVQSPTTDSTPTSTSSSPDAAAAAAKQQQQQQQPQHLQQGGSAVMGDMERSIEETKKRAAELEAESDEWCGTVNKHYKQLDDLVASLNAIRSEIARAREWARSAKHKKEITKADSAKIQAALKPVSAVVTKVHCALTPQPGSFFVRWFLGNINVKQYRQGEKFLLKKDYEKFKRRMNPVFVVLVCLAWVFRTSNIFNMLLQIWCLYYYLSLVMRENILHLNGSHIKSWWIMHHYLSIAICLVMLFWPIGKPSFQIFQRTFLAYGFAQSVVQALQSRYQQKRLYKMVAMGKASPMDVTGEGGELTDVWSPNLVVLFPFLLCIQVFQAYIAYVCWGIILQSYLFDWQAALVGALFATLSAGNFATTTLAYFQKWNEYIKPSADTHKVHSQ